MYDVITIGSATVDFFADTDSELIKIQTRNTKEEMIAFPLSSKLLINQLDIKSGGGGTNSAVCFARLGLKTGFLGKLGSDANADFVQKDLTDEGVDFLGARDGVTGMSVILNGLEKDRTILAYKGANNFLTDADVASVPSTRWIYLSSMLGQSFDTVSRLIERADCQVAFNPSNYQVELGLEKLRPMLASVDVLMMNKEEACKLVGLNYAEDPDIRVVFEKLGTLPPRIFVVTNGGNGAYVKQGDTLFWGKPSPDCVVSETTGAGDAFSSTFIAGLAMEHSVEDSIRMALSNAESVLRYKGAKNDLLSREKLMKKVDEERREVVRM